jgi:hypothetical protein
LSAINRVRKSESRTLSAAARVEGTTVRTIRRLFPAALLQDQRGGRIGVKAGDSYSARVTITTEGGYRVVNARGSRERGLAGRHGATVRLVLRGKKPASALEEFRDKKVGGHALLTDFNLLLAQAHAGVLDQLDSLYVISGTRT